MSDERQTSEASSDERNGRKSEGSPVPCLIGAMWSGVGRGTGVGMKRATSLAYSTGEDYELWVSIGR